MTRSICKVTEVVPECDIHSIQQLFTSTRQFQWFAITHLRWSDTTSAKKNQYLKVQNPCNKTGDVRTTFHTGPFGCSHTGL